MVIIQLEYLEPNLWFQIIHHYLHYILQNINRHIIQIPHILH